jgi:hypothetical protein
MSANPWIDQFDVDAHAVFEGAGMACRGIYTAPAGEPVERRAYVNPATQAQGEWGQIHAGFTTIDFLLADGAVVPNATFVVGARTYTVQRIAEGDAGDGSLQRWVVA